jgi:hypothetical protein
MPASPLQTNLQVEPSTGRESQMWVIYIAIDDYNLQTGDCPTDDSIETDLELCFEPLVQSGY